MVRTKFTCTAKKETQQGFDITLEPVTSGSKENEGFYKYTPSGEIVFSTINHNAALKFKVGNEYYVDFIACADDSLTAPANP